MADETKKLKLDELFRKVLTGMAADLGAFASALHSTPIAPEVLEKAYGIAHSLHGAGSLYGHPCVSELGASLEKVTKALREGALAPSPSLIAIIKACAAVLRDVARSEPSDETVTRRVCALAWACECALHVQAMSPTSGSPSSSAP